MKTFVVIGLGRFGSAVATELSSLGHEVLAVDERRITCRGWPKRSPTPSPATPGTPRFCGPGRAQLRLRRGGGGRRYRKLRLITLNLKEIGVKRVICKAQSHVHRKVLEKIGADRVVFPEHEMGVKLAQGSPAPTCSTSLS